MLLTSGTISSAFLSLTSAISKTWELVARKTFYLSQTLEEIFKSLESNNSNLRQSKR